MRPEPQSSEVNTARPRRIHLERMPEPNFEAVLAIPVDHRLVLVRSVVRGGGFGGVYWHHEEYAPSGQVHARYESFREANTSGEAVRSGWRKYDRQGRLIDQGHLP